MKCSFKKTLNSCVILALVITVGYILFKRCPEAPTYRAQYDFGSQIFLVLGR